MPTDRTAKQQSPLVHGPLVVASPAGERTFGIECTGVDFWCKTVFETAELARDSDEIKRHLADVAALVDQFSVECLQRARDYGLNDADLFGWTEATLDKGLLAAAIFQGLRPRQLASWMQQYPGDPDRVWAAWAAHSVKG